MVDYCTQKFFGQKIDKDGEIALSRSTEKFISRFSLMENEVLKSGKSLTDLSLTELDKIYNKVKRNGN